MGDGARGMTLAELILILSAVIFFGFEVTCPKTLPRQFDREYSQSTAKLLRLGCPSLRRSVEEFGPRGRTFLPRSCPPPHVMAANRLDDAAISELEGSRIR